jgi:hypothetical protein
LTTGQISNFKFQWSYLTGAQISNFTGQISNFKFQSNFKIQISGQISIWSNSKLIKFDHWSNSQVVKIRSVPVLSDFHQVVKSDTGQT